MAYVRSIRVRDAQGAELTLHVFEDRRFLKKVRKMKLCSTEHVSEIDGRLVVGRRRGAYATIAGSGPALGRGPSATRTLICFDRKRASKRPKCNLASRCI